MRTRTGRYIAVLGMVGALVAGCGSGPSRVDSAAIVGDESIPLSEVQPAITSVLTRPGLAEQLQASGGSGPEIGRVVVSQLVIRDLLERTAAEQGISVSDQQVTEEIDRAGGEEAVTAQSLAVGGARAAVRDQLLLTELARRDVDRLSVTADVAVAESRDEATALARDLAAGGSRAEAALAEPGTTQRGLTVRPSETPQLAASPLIGIPAGWVAVVSGGEGQRWLVIRVTERTLDGPPAEPEASAAARLDPATLSEAGLRLLTPTSLRTGVELNPRYGVWDPVQMLAVPAEQASEVIPVGDGAAAPPAG
ncbi:SurA N-terminal domain-containing protein [Pseudonocardia nematodicida]|uniref:SurA N-terminal domain-containing protein n=1 Tax=Pseudonocardia nematodicida TaxID=1206997 RepID=A0ABV1KB38_9PSEU